MSAPLLLLSRTLIPPKPHWQSSQGLHQLTSPFREGPGVGLDFGGLPSRNPWPLLADGVFDGHTEPENLVQCTALLLPGLNFRPVPGLKCTNLWGGWTFFFSFFSQPLFQMQLKVPLLGCSDSEEVFFFFFPIKPAAGLSIGHLKWTSFPCPWQGGGIVPTGRLTDVWWVL